MIALILTTVCTVMGSPPMTAPNNSLGCTPGSYQSISTESACTSRNRPSTPAAVRRDVLARYRVPNWSGQNGEIDHRVPFWAGGNTNVRNLWPEEGLSKNNPKDLLENYTRRRVCVLHTMRLRTARRIFLADWRSAYKFYHLGRVQVSNQRRVP